MAVPNSAELLLKLTSDLSRRELRRVHVHVREAAGDAVKQHAERLTGQASDQRRLRDHAFPEHTLRTSWNKLRRRRRGIEPHHDAGGALGVRAAVDVRLRHVLDICDDQLEPDLAAVIAHLEDRLTLRFGVIRDRTLSVSGQVRSVVMRVPGMHVGLDLHRNRDGCRLSRSRCIRAGAGRSSNRGS
jgi:hypothetical protein